MHVSFPAAFSFEQSTYAGAVSELMRPGAAGPFVQPWYEPVPCTPLDTGMPLGGLGSAFTLTPAGTTPVVSLLNGYYLNAPDAYPLRLRNLFFSEREPDAPLKLIDHNVFRDTSVRYKLVRPDGSHWVKGTETPSEFAQVLADMAACKTLYQDNRAALERWQIKLSPGAANSSANVLIDLYGACVGREQRFHGALTGDVQERTICGQPAYPADQMHHIGLYPVAQTEHKAAGHVLAVTTRSYSPVIAGDERASTLPVSITEVVLHNPGNTPLEGTVAWTIENLCGDQVQKKRPGEQDAWFELLRSANGQQGESFCHDGVTGIVLDQKDGAYRGDFDGTMCLALTHDGPPADVHVCGHPSLAAAHEAQVVREFLANGRVLQRPFPNAMGRERHLGVLGATVLVPPGQTRTLSFCLVLDFPHIQTGALRRTKKYASFYPDAEQRAQALAIESLGKRAAWRDAIAADHAKLGQDGGIATLLADAPDAAAAARLLTLLANQLAMPADALIWDTDDRCDIRECVDYPWFNSLDVYFYGSFMLTRLLPRLDGMVMRHFARCIMEDDPTLRRFFFFATHPHADLPDPSLEGPRSVVGAVPHDAGSPYDPQADGYNWRNVKQWKDLAPKFVLMVLRYFRQSGDESFLRDCWPAVSASIDYLVRMIPEGQSIPFMGGQDDTFDNLASYGISVYSGSLWVAGLAAGATIARTVGADAEASAWTALSERAHVDLTEHLWSQKDGCYLFYKVPGTDRQSDDVFADQLLADVWTRLLDLPPITPPERMSRAVGTIVEKNFHINSPGVGAANMVACDGSALPEFQAQDIWLGVQYSLASAALLVGRAADSWSLLEAQYDNLYVKAKIPFGAPEGFNASNPHQLEYTAGRYLRPGMLWALAYLRPQAA